MVLVRKFMAVGGMLLILVQLVLLTVTDSEI